MIKSGFSFKFAIPEDWFEIVENSRYIYQGPKKEELIVSGSIIKGLGLASEFFLIREKLFENAVKSVKNAVTHPELVIRKELEIDAMASELPCWTLQSETNDGEIIFYAAIFKSDYAILLVTFEAPNTQTSKSFYLNFLKSVSLVIDR